LVVAWYAGNNGSGPRRDGSWHQWRDGGGGGGRSRAARAVLPCPLGPRCPPADPSRAPRRSHAVACLARPPAAYALEGVVRGKGAAVALGAAAAAAGRGPERREGEERALRRRGAPSAGGLPGRRVKGPGRRMGEGAVRRATAARGAAATAVHCTFWGHSAGRCGAARRGAVRPTLWRFAQGSRSERGVNRGGGHTHMEGLRSAGRQRREGGGRRRRPRDALSCACAAAPTRCGPTTCCTARPRAARLRRC
jgi:hypothetical protein